MATTQREFKKEKDRKLSIFGVGDKAGMGILTIEINYRYLSIVWTIELLKLLKVIVTLYRVSDWSVL